MEKLDLLNNALKMFFITIYSYFVYIKITNYKNNTITKTIFIALTSIIFSIIYTLLNQCFQSWEVFIFLYPIYGVIMGWITKDELNYSLIVTIISFIITYTIYLISVVFAGIFVYVFMKNIYYKDSIVILIIALNTILILNFIFKIKRFKGGFKFLLNKDITKKIGILPMIYGYILLLIFDSWKETNNPILNTFLLFCTILIIVSIFIWSNKQITKFYRENIINKTIDEQQDEIDKQKSLIETLTSQNLELSSIIHKYNNRLSALELSVKEQILNLNTEFSTELLKETRDLSSQFSNEVLRISNKNTVISKTNIIGIDNIFRYMAIEADKDNIKFNLKINESINYLIQNIIKQSQFETLIGDHIKDAIIAINANNNGTREIMVILGVVDNCYELCIYDTGTEFEIETLLKLGLEPITTHKDEGGSGIGFMTTFETLKECKGSLIIEEYEKLKSNYTKSVTIRFDGKSEYRIKSYRADEIKKESKDNRIIIENL